MDGIMDALGNPGHVSVATDKARPRAGTNHVGLYSYGKVLSLYVVVSGKLLKGFKQKNILKSLSLKENIGPHLVSEVYTSLG